MPVVAPPALTAPPVTPDRNDSSTFSNRAFALDDFERTTKPAEYAALANNVFANATDAATSADAAATAVGNANSAAGNAATSAGNANTSAQAAAGSVTAAETAAIAAQNGAGLPAPANSSFLQISAGGVLSFLAKSAETFWLASTGGKAKALGYTFLDKGSIAANGTVVVLVSDGEVQRIQALGNITVQISGWSASGTRNELELELVNFGGKTVTITNLAGTVLYIIAGGGSTSVAGSSGITYQTAGTDFVRIWSRNAGAQAFFKALR